MSSTTHTNAEQVSDSKWEAVEFTSDAAVNSLLASIEHDVLHAIHQDNGRTVRRNAIDNFLIQIMESLRKADILGTTDIELRMQRQL